jgi:NAD(P)-dependent dehydrogenase (short-subunit alcohol dehydrogenase family)
VSESKLEGQVAFVTGAGRGIGRAIARALAADGAAVGVCARTESQVRQVADEIAAQGGTAVAMTVDVRERAAVERAVARIESELGAVSVLVNNAGTLDAIGPFWATDPDRWWGDVEVHVRGTLLCTHAVPSHMIAAGSGRIINVLGMLGQTGEPYVSAYACAKASLFRLTDLLDIELSDHGIKVFSISPGPVRTQMTDPFVENDSARSLVPYFAAMEADEWGSPEKGAQLIVRLASGEADVLSGRFIHADDDLDGLLASREAITSSDRLKMRVVRG